MRGLLKFSTDEQQHDSWKIREAVVLDALEKELQKEVDESLIELALAVASGAGGAAYEKARKSHYALRRKLVPYMGQEREEDMFERLRQMWIDRFGDPKDA